MQYPVPQFTDVEDRIIGSLTFIQFGIVFGAGIIVFLGYTATKSIAVLIVFIVIFGIPALALAFAKPFGRPLYRTIPYMLKFIFGPKVLVFHKDSNFITNQSKFKSVEISQAAPSEAAVPVDPRERLKEVNRLLQQQAAQEEQLLKQVK